MGGCFFLSVSTGVDVLTDLLVSAAVARANGAQQQRIYRFDDRNVPCVCVLCGSCVL